MRSQATAKAYLSRTRPQLRRQRDGTAVYTGHAFTATIGEDGSVSFSDRPGIQTEGFSTSGSFDLGDVFMRASGQDPYAAEREWFMEQTEAERGRLEDAWRARSMASALAGIPAHCERIWGRAGTPPERRRRMLFELWDEAVGGDDCDDADPARRGATPEIPGDGVDQDCDGVDDVDLDDDGAWSAADCDDADACTTDRCDARLDRCASSTRDADGDGDNASAYGGDDCDDGDAAINVSASETWYDGVDQDCDGANDYDQDGDLWGRDGDCDDTNPGANPGANDNG
jgi:hypothetical protein